MKLTCDLCGGELEMNAAGQGAVCKNCGLTYTVERLKEKFAAQPTEMPVVEDVIYDVVDYKVVDGSHSGGNSQKPPVVKTPPVTNASSSKLSAAEMKKAQKRMRIMWILLGLFCFSAFVCAMTIEEPIDLSGALYGHAIWIVIILFIFKPWKVYGGKP